jgi:hypothetical protein
LAYNFDLLTSLISDLDPVLPNSPLFPLYKSLQEIKSDLELVKLESSSSSSSTTWNPAKHQQALQDIQKRLETEVESHRIDGTFVPPFEISTNSAAVLPGQASLHKLLHTNHALLTSLLHHAFTVERLSSSSLQQQQHQDHDGDGEGEDGGDDFGHDHEVVVPLAPVLDETLIPMYETLISLRSELRNLRRKAATGRESENVEKEMERCCQVLKGVEEEGKKKKSQEEDGEGERVESFIKVGYQDLLSSGQGKKGDRHGEWMISLLVDECDSLLWEIRCIIVVRGARTRI